MSPYLVGEVVVGDRLELRGPIGGYFVWDGLEPERPQLLIGGGSGVVTLMAMIRHRRNAGLGTPTRLLFSSRSVDDVIYCDELDRLSAADDGFSTHHALTRAQPPGWKG